MTLEPSIDKQRVDFSHNYTKIRIRCPECFRTIKGKNHVRIYKNLSGLWRHIKLEHGEFFNLEFNTNLIRDVLKHIALAIEWGMFPDVSETYHNTTTSLSIIYDGKPAREDVLINLKEIAGLLKIQSGIYPHYSPRQLYAFMGVKLGPRDKRTVKKYFDCITNYSQKNIQDGTYNVTNFCNLFQS